MVYCGKPSKGCQMCRTRRIKCDETKPTCNQCAKARRQCPGYRDEFDLVLRNENFAAKRRALKLTTPRRSNIGRPPKKPTPSSTSSSTTTSPSSSLPSPPHPQQRQQQRHPPPPPPLAPSPLHLPPEDLAPCHFVSNFVLLPRQDGSRGFLDYLIPLMREEAAGGEMHLQHAFNACALASWGNRVSSSSSPSPSPSSTAAGLVPRLVTARGGGDAAGRAEAGLGATCTSKAFAEYSKALRATQAALVDPEKWRSDGVLAAVLLLGMFENITAKQLGNLAWGSHVEGAIQLIKARGRGQLKTKLGVQLFIAVRTQLVIHALTSGTGPAMGADWWMQDAVVDSTAAECHRVSLMAGELRGEITLLMAAASRTPENIERVQGFMHRAQHLDELLTAWIDSLPAAWRFKTLCWQSHSLAVPGGGKDYSRAEVFPGRVDVYSDFWVAGVWNMARATRLALMSITVRCAAWICSPLDYRTTPEYATAARVCVDTISDILASVPYHLGWHVKRRDLFSQDEAAAFACGDESGMKALAAYFLTWPLACVMTQDNSTDAQRAYVRGRLDYIGDEVGVKYAHILSQLRFRVPSMLIRSDGLLAKPYPMAHNLEKLVSATRQAYPLSPACAPAALPLPVGWQHGQAQGV